MAEEKKKATRYIFKKEFNIGRQITCQADVDKVFINPSTAEKLKKKGFLS